MISAKDFFYTANEEIEFTIAFDIDFESNKTESFYSGIARDEIISALDTVSLYEEIYGVSYFDTSFTKTGKMYVWLKSRNGEYEIMRSILAKIAK